jgi:hypothetical protein
MEDKIRPHIVKLSGDPTEDYDGLLRQIGDARVVMIGEASHGTHDFYDERQKITRRLVEEKVSAHAWAHREINPCLYCVDGRPFLSK